MWDFLKYWLHNCSVGLHFGNGVFSYIAGVCAVISAGLFLLKKRYRHKWKRWEKFIMKMAFYLFVTSFFIATFLIAPFLRHRENRMISINTNPEAKENKYIRIEKISPPDIRFKQAILIEFGINKLRSEGLAIAVDCKGDSYEDWYGEPNRTDKQDGDVLMQYDGQWSTTNSVLRLKHKTLQITPRKSYYLCIMSYSKEIAEPNNILYFAVELNERMKLSPKKEILGHQYQRR